MGKVITVSILKGGSGKTSTVLSLAGIAAKKGKRALVLDMDPQASLSYWIKADLSGQTTYDLIQGKGDILPMIQKTDSGIDCIPGDPSLSALKTSPASGRRLERALEPIKKKYSLIIIDTAPTLSEGLYNSLFAADDVLLTLESDSLSVQALYQMSDNLGHVQANKPDLKIAGCIITRYDARSRITRYMKDQIQSISESLDIPFLGTIRKGIAVSESMAMRENLFEYAPKSKPAEDYEELYNKLTKKG